VRPAIFGRRRVEQFAQRLESSTAPTASESLDREVAVAQALAARAEDFAPAPSAQFSEDLRTMLMAAARKQGVGLRAVVDEPTEVLPLGVVRRPVRRGLRPSLRGRRTRAAVIAGLFTGTLAVSGISLASGSAMPGDPLYGVKRSGEDARLALAGSDRDRGTLYVQFARTRTREAQSSATSSDLSDLFDLMDHDTQQATALLTKAALENHDATVLDPLVQFVADQQRDLGALAGRSPQTHRLTTQSIDLLTQVSNRIVAVRAAIACGATWSDDGSTLGPSVAACR
jgi:Domain of unknown function (DUF5667)